MGALMRQSRNHDQMVEMGVKVAAGTCSCDFMGTLTMVAQLNNHEKLAAKSLLGNCKIVTNLVKWLLDCNL